MPILKPLRDVVLSLAQSEHYLTVNTVLARILAAKSHSADVERLISLSNTLKTSDRSSTHLDTENMYLFVYYNMPSLYVWDPIPAVLLWRNKCRHRVTDRPKRKEQRYFHGVFPEASAKRTFSDVESDSSGDDICVMQKSKVKTF